VLSAIISVLASDYALFFGPYYFYLWFFGWIKKRRDGNGFVSV
jgi:hypothetical protein